MINKFGVEIADKRLWEIIAKTDIFVSTFSPTVAWALICEKKVVIINNVSLGYKDFYSEFEIPVCTSNIEMKATTENVLDSQSGLNSKFIPLISTLSPFDSKCRQCILDNLV